MQTLEMTVGGSDLASEVAKQLICTGVSFSCVCVDNLNELYAINTDNGKALALIVADANKAFERAESVLQSSNIIAFKMGGQTVYDKNWSGKN